ncbi:MAG: baseplate J/gp47 family protein [Anaerolineales bacterium]|nr:baseplate J/gp47 family protein [Anaerolineales bacterium]
MKRVILDSEDDIISICDRLDWADAQQVLFILPPDGGALREGLDLARLRRYADRLRIEVGLVTPDVTIRRQAQALGIPVFNSERAADSRRGWWRGRRRDERVGLPTTGAGQTIERTQQLGMNNADRQEAARRISPKSLRRQWMVRYFGILLFCITISLLYVSFIYAVPGATVVLKPETVPLHVEAEIVADPEFDVIDYENGRLPGRVLSVETAWQAEMATTGTVDVPNAPARGPILFVNLIAQEVTIPAGTRVSTSDGSNVVFQTIEDVTIPDVVGSTAEVEVIAVEPGPQGNVGANLVNRVEGALATQVEVRNLEPLTGGGVRQEPAVSEADMARLRSQVMQFLQALAASEMEAQLTEREFLTRDSLRITTIFSETYSNAVGEQAARLTLEMRAELTGTAVNTTEASGLAYETLVEDVPLGHRLVPESIRFSSGDVLGTDDAGRVTFVMVADGVAAANLDIATPLDAIVGQEADTAVAYLQQSLPLRDRPTIEIWPVWFERVPYAAARVQVEVVP